MPRSMPDTESTRKLREEFAKACFETLLQFSFLGGIMLPEGGVVNRLAVTSLLHRFQEVSAGGGRSWRLQSLAVPARQLE